MDALRGLALSTLLPAFHGAYPPDWALRLTEDGLAGFALFGYNIRDLDQVAAICDARELSAMNASGESIPRND